MFGRRPASPGAKSDPCCLRKPVSAKPLVGGAPRPAAVRPIPVRKPSLPIRRPFK